MTNGRVALVLLYEPAAARQRPVPLARVIDGRLAADVARRAVAEADARAESIAQADSVLGKVERAEAQRLRDVLAAVLPELFQREGETPELLM